jgi:hypothetical protein
MLDNFKNLVKVETLIGYDSVATTIVLKASHAARLPTAPFNALWYDYSDFKDPSDDPNVEIIRVTVVNTSTDTLTIIRPAVGNSYNNEDSSNVAHPHNITGKIYRIVPTLTAKTLNTDLVATFIDRATASKADVGLGNVDNTSDVNKPVSTAQAAAIALKVDKNAAITGATKTKITYDSKGLVTSGSDATTADIADSTNKRYVTDANLTTIGNTSGVNTGDQNLSGLQPLDSDLTAIAALTPSNDDIIQRKSGAWTNRTPSQFKTDLVLVKADVGLSSVDNTSDANKPVSTAQQAALDLKAPNANPIFTGVVQHAVGSGDPLSPPQQITPVTVNFGTYGAYSNNGAGNNFHFSSWVEATGTRPTIAAFVYGKANGAGSQTWGINIVGYANNATAVAHGAEIDFGTLVSGGTALGLGINVGGGFAIPGGGAIQIGSVLAGSTMGFGIRFINAGINPITGNLIDTSGAISCVDGINFSSATFSGNAFSSPNFSVSGSGSWTAVNGTLSGSLTAPTHYGGIANGSTLTLKGSSSAAPAASYVIVNPQIVAGTSPGGLYIGASTSQTQDGASASDLIHLQASNAKLAQITLDTYGSAIGAVIMGRLAGGTTTTPTATVTDDTLLMLCGRGYQTTTNAFTTINNVSIQFKAAEGYTSTAQGGYMVFRTVTIGNAAASERWRVEHGGWFVGQPLSANITTTELTSSNQGAVYVKSGKLVFAYNDAGTLRFKSLDLTGTGVTWVHATTGP